jgi:hypothetical protein
LFSTFNEFLANEVPIHVLERRSLKHVHPEPLDNSKKIQKDKERSQQKDHTRNPLLTKQIFWLAIQKTTRTNEKEGRILWGKLAAEKHASPIDGRERDEEGCVHDGWGHTQQKDKQPGVWQSTKIQMPLAFSRRAPPKFAATMQQGRQAPIKAFGRTRRAALWRRRGRIWQLEGFMNAHRRTKIASR